MTLAAPALPSHCQLSRPTTPPLPVATAPCPPRSWEKRRVTFKFITASKEEPGGGGEGECGTAGLKEGVASLKAPE